jgi:hypothetical protein
MATFTPETIATVAGLLLTTVGAAVAARAVIVTEQQATELASPMWDLNPKLKASLIRQSRTAMYGLGLMVAGTALQLIGIVLHLATL